MNKTSIYKSHTLRIKVNCLTDTNAPAEVQKEDIRGNSTGDETESGEQRANDGGDSPAKVVRHKTGNRACTVEDIELNV